VSDRKRRRRRPSERNDGNPGHFESTLLAAQGGSALAFEQLVRSLSARLLSFARSRRAADPEGLVNEVLLSVFRRIARFEGSEPQFNAWVFTIARNQLIDEARRRQRRPVETIVRDPETHSPAVESVEDEVVAGLGTERLLARLDVLTADQRDVVLLRVVADLTIETIAETLGKKPGAIKALQRRAFRTLADELAGESGVPL